MDQETSDKMSDDEILAIRGMTKEQGEKEAIALAKYREDAEKGVLHWVEGGCQLILKIPQMNSCQFEAGVDFDFEDDEDVVGYFYAWIQLNIDSDPVTLFEKRFNEGEEAKKAIELEINRICQKLFRFSIGMLGKYYPGYTIA